MNYRGPRAPEQISDRNINRVLSGVLDTYASVNTAISDCHRTIGVKNGSSMMRTNRKDVRVRKELCVEDILGMIRPVCRQIVLKSFLKEMLKLTSNYIYETLFVGGQESDVVVSALGKQWHLHKIYLKQCAYFSSMFSGSWRESNDSQVEIVTPDPRVDAAALDIAFMALYKDDVTIPRDGVVNVLAAATLLQLESLQEHCRVVMTETLRGHNAVSYYTAAMTYGLPDIADECLTWLLHNILSRTSPHLLSDISVDLMTKLISSPDLCVTQLETDVYTMLKKWMFLRLHPTLVRADDVLQKCDAFFESRKTGPHTCMLLSDDGRRFIPAFQAVRWHFVINDQKSLLMVQTDEIIPMAWLTPVFHFLLQHMLLVDSGSDTGPEQLDEETFNKTSFRCGRLLPLNCRSRWRWVGYNYGIDILFSCTSGILTMCRNSSHDSSGAVSQRHTRAIAYRITMVSLDKNGKCKHHQTSGLRHLLLTKNQEAVVFIVDPEITFPAVLSVNMLTFTPNISTAHSHLDVPSDNRAVTAPASTQTDYLPLSLYSPASHDYDSPTNVDSPQINPLIHQEESTNDCSKPPDVPTRDLLTDEFSTSSQTDDECLSDRSASCSTQCHDFKSTITSVSADKSVLKIKKRRYKNKPARRLTLESSSSSESGDSIRLSHRGASQRRVGDDVTGADDSEYGGTTDDDAYNSMVATPTHN